MRCGVAKQQERPLHEVVHAGRLPSRELAHEGIGGEFNPGVTSRPEHRCDEAITGVPTRWLHLAKIAKDVLQADEGVPDSAGIALCLPRRADRGSESRIEEVRAPLLDCSYDTGQVPIADVADVGRIAVGLPLPVIPSKPVEMLGQGAEGAAREGPRWLCANHLPQVLKGSPGGVRPEVDLRACRFGLNALDQLATSLEMVYEMATSRPVSI
jgi:hypothetical protein